MFGGGSLTDALTLKSFVGGGKTGAFDPNKLKGVDAGGGGGGCGGLGP